MDLWPVESTPSRRALSGAFTALLLLALAGPGRAAPCSFTFTSADTIQATDLVFDGCDITVRATTLTVNGPHTFASLAVVDGGRVTSSRLDSLTLAVTGNLSISAGSRLSVERCGYAIGAGPGAGTGGSPATGGSHAGRGGGVLPSSGPSYDDFLAPRDFGSGGGLSGVSTAAGGGAIRLAVAGELRVDGELSARADSATTLTPSYSPGGGAGGSIHLIAGSIVGTGRIDVGGGRGWNAGGGGGGGRIALEYGTNTFAGTLSARGGLAGTPARGGAAGTIWMRRSGEPRGVLLVENSGLAVQARTDFVDSLTTVPGDLILHGAGIVSVRRGSPLTLDVQGDVEVAAGAAVSVAGCGFALAAGPGAGSAGAPAGGGAYGGRGGGSRGASGITYGTLFGPSSLGSGGGSSGVSEGRGGGALRLTVLGQLRLDGMLSARGDSASTVTASYSPGGGSGGSLWVVAGSISGTGAIDAGGGRGFNQGGGGGGGRIAVEYGSSTFAGSMRARGAESTNTLLAGAAGTLWSKLTGASSGELVVANGGQLANARTELPDSNLVIAGSLRIRERGILSVRRTLPLRLTVTGDAEIETGSGISLDGCGFAMGSGPGAGGSGSPAGGGGYGGRGGSTTAAGGATYGSADNPVDMGSGGGASGLGSAYGGGALQLDIAGALRLDGTLSARGDSASVITAGYSPGGGSGGSLFVHAGSLTGSGTVDASGGKGFAGGGGGGGGRVAMFTTCWSGFSPAQIAVNGAAGGVTAAQPGTVFPDFEIGTAAGPVATSGAVVVRRTPASFVPGANESDSLIVVRERGRVHLAAGDTIHAEISVPGMYLVGTPLSPFAIAPGAWVDAHLVHLDPAGGSSGRVHGSVTFDTNVLGVIVSGPALDASDALLHAPGVDYAAGLAERGVEFVAGADGDSIELSDDRRTLTFALGVASGIDQMRVVTTLPVTTCGPVANAPAPSTPVGSRIALLAPFPNPSRGRIALRFGLSESCPARLAVFDVAGRHVATLLDGVLPAGWHVTEWTPGGSNAGAANLFFIRLETPFASRSTRLLSLR